MKKETQNKPLKTNEVLNKFIYLFIIHFFPLPLISQPNNQTVQLPNCENIKEININIEAALKDENHYQFLTSRDTIEYLYCFSKKENNPKLEAFSLLKLASNTINTESGKEVFERFIILLNMSMEISEKNQFYTILLTAKELLCSNFTTNKMYDQADFYAHEIIRIATQVGDSVKIAEGNMLLGRILREEGKYYKSDSVLNNSLKYLNKTAPANIIGAYTYLHLSKLKRLEKKYDESIDFGIKGLSYARRTIFHREFMEGNLAIEIILSNIENGTMENEKWLKILKKSELKYKWLNGKYDYVMGIIYEKNGQTNKAINSYLQSLRYSDNAGASHSTFEITQRIFPLLNLKTELSNRALETCKLSRNAFDRIIYENGSNNLLKTTYYNLENEKNKTELLQLNLKSSYKIISFSTCLIILFISLILLIVRQTKKNKIFYSKIDQLNLNLTRKNNKLNSSYTEIKKNKNELLAELKQQLLLVSNQNNMIDKLKKHIELDDEVGRKSKQQISSILNLERNNEIIEDINIKFLELNDSLLIRLSSNFPMLTSNDLKLCIYLSMNLSTKEIAQIQYKSTDSIKVARSRLRKKLNIQDNSLKLSAFLNGYKIPKN